MYEEQPIQNSSTGKTVQKSIKQQQAVKIIIAGAPASGKVTQCETIKEKFGVVHLSTGDMLRAAVAAGIAIGKQAKEYMDSGKLVPDDVIIGVVRRHDWNSFAPVWVSSLSKFCFRAVGKGQIGAR